MSVCSHYNNTVFKSASTRMNMVYVCSIDLSHLMKFLDFEPSTKEIYLI